MSKLLSTLSFAFRQAVKATGVPLSTGHAQQLLAAALGHQSLASLQQAPDLGHWDEANTLVVDGGRLFERAKALGVNHDDVVDPLWNTLRAHFSGKLHEDLGELLEGVQERVDQRVWNDDQVVSEMAMTNAYGPGEIYLPLETGGVDVDSADDLQIDIEGHVRLDQDPDKVFWGTHIDVHAGVTVPRLGRRLFGLPTIEVQHAQLRWFNEAPDDALSDQELAESVG